ncbi:RNA polymerase sigma-54 factor, partial [Vibrio parahaemolyticus]
EVEEGHEEPQANGEDKSALETADNSANEPTEIEVPDSSDVIEKSEISSELEIDTTWDDVYSANTGSTGLALDDDMPVYQGETTESLHDYLMWQLDLTPFSETDRTIAIAIIDAIDDYGYLTLSPEEIHESFDNEDIELDEVEAVRKRIQQFDPLGVASRNLQECLLLQLATFPEDTPWLAEAKMILADHIDHLGNRDYKLVIKETKLKEADLREVLKLIQQLDPRPGSRITPDDTEYVIPDVSVFKDHGKWTVSINPDSIPKLKVNQQYAQLGKGNSADSQYIRSNLQEAHTPRGIFELKYFFSSHVSTDNGGECSSTAIRALIKKLVAAENTAKPLSDSKIAALLADQGIQVARRTIAKYRESLGIAPSSQRKRLL